MNIHPTTQKHYRIASSIARFLDTRIDFFGKRFGWDPIIGLIPVVGDAIVLIISIYIIIVGIMLRLPIHKISMMILNVLADFGISTIPVAGDVGDFFFRASHLNMNIIDEHLAKHNIDLRKQIENAEFEDVNTKKSIEQKP